MLSPRDDYEKQCAQIEEDLSQVVPEPLRARVLRFFRPAILLSTSPASGELLPLASKFGGLPDAPLGFEWPSFGGEPLGFVAQLNLAELSQFDLDGRLPKVGLLSFWTNGAWGDAEDFGSWRVFHFKSEDWQRLEEPASETWWKRWLHGKRFPSFRCAPVLAQVWATLPDRWEDTEFQGEEFDPIVAGALSPLPENYGHRMFGFPDSVQEDVREACARDWNRFLALPQADRLGLSAQHDQAQWQDFELLLQIKEDDNAKMQWGDLGAVYFLIRSVDLRAQRFERCWFVLQSC